MLLIAAPANAAPYTCADGGTAVGGGICELTYNSGPVTFTPPANTSKLEALLVGGGSGSYAGCGGGGGAVSVVNFADTKTPVHFAVGLAGAQDTDGGNTTATQGASVHTANGGLFATEGNGGTSGNGHLGWQTSQWVDEDFASAGGGAGASPTSTAVGGAGLTAAAAGGAGSLFAGDTSCYGGGGGVFDFNGNDGSATCGGGYATTAGLVDPIVNSGGGGGSVTGSSTYDTNPGWAQPSDGADGVVVVRWVVTLAETGVDVSPWAIPGALGALAIGAGFVVAAGRRRARA